MKDAKIQYQRKPFEVAFGISFDRFLGFVVHKEGIGLNSTKVRSKQMMAPLTN